MEPPPVVLGAPLEVCPLPVNEIAAAVDAQPNLSAAQIVELITGRVRLNERGRALLVAAVDGAVASHRYQAERLAQSINLAAEQDPGWLPLLAQHPMLKQLCEILQGRLTSALSRPF
jgi:cell wall assembly regulator SMI1